MVPASASRRFCWPSRQLFQVGEFASSKSAMKTFAPEFKALITIFRSVGPVISTRRSSRSEGMGATRHSRSRISRVPSRKSGLLAAVELFLASATGVQQLLPGRIKSR